MADVIEEKELSIHINSLNSPQAPSVSSLSTESQNGPTFTESHLVKYKNKFFEFIEELRMRRDTNVENEKKLHELLSLRHKLEQELERQKEKLSETLQYQINLETETQKKCNEQLRQLEEDKTKLTYSFEGKEKEFQSLKDEIRALHMSKYSLEKKIGEQEYSLQILNTSRDSYCSQLNQMEQNCVDIDVKMNQLYSHIDTLDSNVKEAIKLNKMLQYTNDHQECLITEYKKELEKYQKECISLKAQLASNDTGLDTKESNNINQQLKVEREVVHQLEEQLSDLRGEFCSVLQSLKDAHSLIDKQVETINDASIREASLKDHVSQLTEQVHQAEANLLIAKEESEKQTHELEQELKQHNEKTLDVNARLKSLQEDYTRLQSSHEQLEKENNLIKIDSNTNNTILEQTKKQFGVMKEELLNVKETLVSIEREKDVLLKEINTKKLMLDKEVQTNTDHHDRVESMISSSPDLISYDRSHDKITVEESNTLTSPSIKRSVEPEDQCTVDSPSLKRYKSSNCQESISTCSNIVDTILNTAMNNKGLNNDNSMIVPSPFLSTAAYNKETTLHNNNNSYTAVQLTNTVPSKEENSTTCSSNEVVKSIDTKASNDHETVADSDGENSTSIMFSDEDEELVDTQLSKQINKVHKLLLVDRLKRGKRQYT